MKLNPIPKTAREIKVSLCFSDGNARILVYPIIIVLRPSYCVLYDFKHISETVFFNIYSPKIMFKYVYKYICIMKNITISITTEQYEKIKAKPKTFNLSAEIRDFLEKTL